METSFTDLNPPVIHSNPPVNAELPDYFLSADMELGRVLLKFG